MHMAVRPRGRVELGGPAVCGIVAGGAFYGADEEGALLAEQPATASLLSSRPGCRRGASTGARLVLSDPLVLLGRCDRWLVDGTDVELDAAARRTAAERIDGERRHGYQVVGIATIGARSATFVGYLLLRPGGTCTRSVTTRRR